MNNQTVEKLCQMKLHGMAAGFHEQLQNPNIAELCLEDRFAMIVEKEWTSRENRKLAIRLKTAKLKRQASIEDIDFRHPRGLDKAMTLSLATCEWIRNHHNVIITGPTGIGKSYLAEALAHKACQEGLSAVYYRCTRLFRELAIAKGDGSYLKILNKIAKMDLLELMEDRHALRSTIITSQFPMPKWYELIGDPTIADAILDRIVHVAHKINLKGDSLRKKRSKLTDADHQ